MAEDASFNEAQLHCHLRRSACRAVSQDDWSSVIAAQTEETVDAQPQLPSKDVSSQAVPGPLSPFSTASVQEGIGELALALSCHDVRMD